MGNNKSSVTQDLKAETKWYDEEKFYIDSGHWTSLPIFVSRERHWMQNQISKIRFYSYLIKYISSKSYFHKAKILIAPIGTGANVQYLQGLYSNIHGADISEKALSDCPSSVITKKTDIIQSGYAYESFDIIICPLILHHVHKVGFEPFLTEYYRILKPGGVLAIQEPSKLFPPTWVTSFLRIFMGNVSGLVPDERPIYPPTLNRNLKNTGFTNIRYRGLSIIHVRFPVLLQSINLLLDFPIRAFWPFKMFCNHIGWYCEKSLSE